MAEIATNRKIYELTVLVTSDLSEFEAEKAVDKIKTSIASKDGELISFSNWGKKKLAYIIKKNEFGFYYTLVINLPTDAVATLTRELELAPEVLRYIVVSLEKEGLTVDQLFTPAKEELMMANSVVKDKFAVPATEVRPRAAKLDVAETTPEVVISQEEIDQKIEDALKSDIE